MKKKPKLGLLLPVLLLIAAAAYIVMLRVSPEAPSVPIQLPFFSTPAPKAPEIPLQISELSAAELECPEGGGNCRWAEIENCGVNALELGGFTLSESGGARYSFPEGAVLAPGSVVLVHFGGCGALFSSPASLPAEGELLLTGADGTVIDRVSYGAASSGQSLVRSKSKLKPSDTPTPGYRNDEEGLAAYRALIESRERAERDKRSIRLSEVMVKNSSVYQAANGVFPDWIELENCSDEPVELENWALSDGGRKLWRFPAVQIGARERLLVCADPDHRDSLPLCADFALSSGETLSLYSPDGALIDELVCSLDTANHSLARDEAGEWRETDRATPGLANTKSAYASFLASRESAGPLAINEVMVSNFSYDKQRDVGFCDWVELKNLSDEPLDLSRYRLSDDKDDYRLWQLPARTLDPGDTLLIYCVGDDMPENVKDVYAPFSLDAAEEDLYLSDEDGNMIDYVYLHEIPRDGSLGRLDGENGFFYFTQPSPGEENAGGFRLISDRPETLTPDGLVGEGPISVELTASGAIYYTLDGSVPSADSTLYTGPITVDKTTLIRALAVEDGAAPSRVRTLSYFVGEESTLPVLSLVTDNSALFSYVYWRGVKYYEIPASLTLYDSDGGGFSMACGVSMKGWTSLKDPKKSMGVSFSGYGEGNLQYDLYGNGVTEFSKLAIRCGQDYPLAVFRTELFEELCAEVGDSVMTQAGRYCLLFIDGEYWGIYNLKEDFTRQYYAEHMGVSKSSVTMLRSPIDRDNELYQDVYAFVLNNDMSDPDNYEQFCAKFDVDSLIDWIIMEGYCANSDVNGNMRYFRSTEGDGKWRVAFYDLDWTFREQSLVFYNVFRPTRIVQISPLCNALLKNEEFRMKLARRCVELSRSVLSNEHVLALIDEYEALLEPEMERERERWGGSVQSWHFNVDKLRGFINDNDMETFLVDRLFYICGFTNEQRAELKAES